MVAKSPRIRLNPVFDTVQAARRRRGLALREFVIIGAILSFFFMLLAPILLQMRAQSRQTSCLRNLQHVGRATLEYEELNGNFPGYRDWQNPSEPGGRRIGWVFKVVPYLRTDPTAERFTPGPWAGIHDRHGPGGDPATRGTEPDVSVPLLICPSLTPPENAPPTYANYVANGGLPDAHLIADDALPDWPQNGVYLDYTVPGSPKTSVSYVQQRDGADMTLMLSENTAAGAWSRDEEAELTFLWDNAEPNAPNRQVLRINREFKQLEASIRRARPSSFHVGGVNVVFVGGGSRFLSDGIDESVYVALMASDNTALKTPGKTTPLPLPYGSP